MLRPTVLLKRTLIFVHRWMGVALSVVFMLWFVSGIVMMYWSYPEVGAKERREHAPVLDPAQIKVTPEEAFASLKLDQSPASAELASFDGRPVYRFQSGGEGEQGNGRRRRRGGGGSAMVYADDGSLQTEVNDAMIDRAATAWTGKPLTEAKKESVEEIDQWTVGSSVLRTLRPLYKYSFADGQQVYVSGRSAEVMQYTTSESRFWAYLGAIPHWIYFTPLRKHQVEWTNTVVWSSGIGSVAALIGIIVAVWMLSPAKRYRHAGAPTSIPYRGWKRWHTIIGLVFGVVTLTWAFSGLLSMGSLRILDWLTGNSRGAAREKGQPRGGGRGGFNIAGTLRGEGRFDLAAYDAKTPSAALASLGSDFRAKELEFSWFAGEPQYIATDSAGHTRVIPLNGDPRIELDRDKILNLLRQAGGSNIAELRVMDQYDAYYLDRHRERPLPVIYARMSDEAGSRFYVDPKTGRTVGTYSSRNWTSRWLYHGLHSLDFPWLYNYRPLWDIVVITLMLGGTALCVTSLVLTYRVLARKFAPVLRARLFPASEDLVLETDR
jgi:PepSY-associated TM region